MNAVFRSLCLSSILVCLSIADVASADEPYENREEVEAWLAEQLPLARNGYIEVNACELVLENQADGDRRVRIDFSKIGPEIIIGGTRVETEGISRISGSNEAGEFTNYGIEIDAGCVTDGGWGSDACSAPLNFGLHRLNSSDDLESASSIRKALVFWAESCHTGPQVIPSSNPFHENVTEETMCPDCYDRNVAEFNEFLDSIKPYAGAPAGQLEKVDDFYISRVGVMIHEGCLEKDFEFIEEEPLIEFEQMITDGVVRGLTCLSKGETYYRTRMEGGVTSAYNLMPAFLKLLTDNSPADQEPQMYFREIDGGHYTRDLNCQNYSSVFPNADKFPIHDDCEEIRDIPSHPKVFCDQDNVIKLLDSFAKAGDRFSQHGARGTNGKWNVPIVKNYLGRTRIYTGPAIFLNADKVKGNPSGEIQSTVFHELFHNLGYEHETEDDEYNLVYKYHNDYGYACQAACFYSEFEEQMENNDVAKESAAKICFNNKYDPSNYSEKISIQGAIAEFYLNN